ncbi:MAG: GNAT family N-acetyltransferase [Thermomicrobiales bacterium]
MIVLEELPAGAQRRAYMDLLLLADESPEQVAGYVDLGTLYIAREDDGVAAGLALVIADGDEAELKSVAVREDRQGRGVARAMLTEVIARQRLAGIRRMTVATGSSSLGPLALYQKLGFRLLRVDRDFFSPERGYPEEIWENGIQLRDMVWLDLDMESDAPR